jgi:AraC-like DNA-binding protein
MEMELNGVQYHYQVDTPSEKVLLPFIEKYIYFSAASGISLQKHLWPDPHVTVIFNFRSTQLNNKKCPDVTVIGLHEDVHLMEPGESEIDTIIVHFTSPGFALFSNVPVSYLSSLYCDAREVFGETVEPLFNTMKSVNDIQARTRLLDAFFLSQLKAQNMQLPYIAELTKNLLHNPELIIPKTGILSYRHFSRLFKKMVGVNLQTFRRLSRFEIAKKLLFQELNIPLTDIGYQSGYFDQAHFAREFKKLSGLNARKFEQLCSI